jgi:anti-sigma regulatory factor (Ser/Thr protein kinase)
MNRADHTPASETSAASTAAAAGARRPGTVTEWSLDQPFGVDDLVALRSAVAAHASHLGLSARRVADLVLIAHELASNAIRHGGGAGRLRLGRRDGGLCCEVADSGAGLPEPETMGHSRAALMAPGGRGLWIVRQLADRVEITTGAAGTTVSVLLSPDGAEPAADTGDEEDEAPDRGAARGGAADEVGAGG